MHAMKCEWWRANKTMDSNLEKPKWKNRTDKSRVQCKTTCIIARNTSGKYRLTREQLCKLALERNLKGIDA